MKYTEEFEQKIKDIAKPQIVEIIGEYVNLKQRGGNFVAKCPFHTEKTASFSVSRGLQMYRCFGCGDTGDTINFLMKYNKWEYVETLDYLAARFGLSDTGDTTPTPKQRRPRKFEKPPQKIEFVSDDFLQQTIKNDKRNNTFFQFLCKTFGDTAENRERVRQVVKIYRLGTYGNAVTFPQIDSENRCRYIKAMTYKTNGHRDKERPPYKLPKDLQNHKQTFFGTHLLNGYTGEIALVEAEKTAVIMAIIDRESRFLWIATGGSQNLAKNAEILKGHSVSIFPDSGEFEQWRQIAVEKLVPVCRRVRIENTLETLYKANPQHKNIDIADIALNEIPEADIYIKNIINQ